MWHRGGRLEQLNTAECRRLLAATSIGRLGYQMDRGPRIVPVNYALAGETIVIRTAPDTEIARFAPGQTVAFETDQVDEFLQTGWSVLAVGKLNLVSKESLRMLATQQMPDPWAEGSRSVFLQLGTDELTGAAYTKLRVIDRLGPMDLTVLASDRGSVPMNIGAVLDFDEQTVPALAAFRDLLGARWQE